VDLFELEIRNKSSKAIRFPDTKTKERYTWGNTTGMVWGFWHTFRVVIGDLLRYHEMIQELSLEYNTQRSLYPRIDENKLFDSPPQIRPTSLEIYPYPGRIDTLARERVQVMTASGQRVGLARDTGVGFYGIVTRTEQPWGMNQYGMEELLRLRMRMMFMGIPFLTEGLSRPILDTSEPWRMRKAAEDQMQTILTVMYAQYMSEQTTQNLDALVSAIKLWQRYVLETMDWSRKLSSWEHMENLKYPNVAAALKLWEQDKVETMLYDELEAFSKVLPTVTGKKVTAILKAYMNIDDKVKVTLFNFPEFTQAEHPTLPVVHQTITYGEPPYVGVGRPNPDYEERWRTPFIGKKGGLAWQGFMERPEQWSFVKGEETGYPEPQLDTRPKLVSLPRKYVERLEAAVTDGRPTLIYLPVNGATAPLLVIPNLHAPCQVVSLFGGGDSLKPTEEGNKVSGYLVADTFTDMNGTGTGDEGDRAPGADPIFTMPEKGFQRIPTTGLSMRDAQITEILPYR
jgi:hypothetical protein